MSAVLDREEVWTAWREQLHRRPELAFEETGTSDFIARQLQALGLEVTRGLAGTGLVATLRGSEPGRAIAFRADMDALPMAEDNTFAHCSENPGRMHACGHDGHIVMLLAGIEKLIADPPTGTVHFIFQPAEEGAGGGRGHDRRRPVRTLSRRGRVRAA